MNTDRPRTRMSLTGLCLAMLLSLPAIAQAADRWYQVEVIVFQNLQPESNEDWPLTPGYPDIDSAIELNDTPDMGMDVLDAGEQAMLREDGGDGDGTTALLAFAELKPEQLTLQPLYRRLQRSAGYRPLLYRAWRQPGLGRTRAKAVHLMARDTPESDALRRPRIDGWLRLRSSHFLHVDTDLVLYIGDLPHSGNAELVRLTETRRVRLNEVHYLDNPLFGVLVKISPVTIDLPVEP